MMKFATRLKVTANVAAGPISTLTLGTATLGCRTLQQAIDAGNAANDATAIKVNDTGVPFVVENVTTGDWEEAYYTITSGTLITKGAIIASSNAGAAVNFPAGTVSVFNAPPGGFLRKVVTTDDGVSLSTLPTLNPASLPSATLLADFLIGPVTDPATGINYNIKLGNLPGSSASPAQQITVNTIATQVAGTAFNVTGAYANGTPGGLEYSINGGQSYVPASAVITGGTFTITGVSVPTASSSQVVLVRDTTTKVVGASAAFLVNAAPYITVNAPASQVVNVAFAVTGWYYNYTPTAFDYRFSDDTAGVWTQPTGTVTINGGNFQFSVTCTTTNTTNRTITVRDRTTNTIVATSAVFSVAAGAATVTGVSINQNNPSVVGGQTLQLTATTTGTNNPSQAGTWSMQSGPGSVNATTGLYTAAPAAATAGTAVVKFVPSQDTSFSATVTITIPAQNITATTPATAPTVGTPYTLSGTWTGLQPTSLQFQYADNGGTATTWASFTNTPTINTNGTWSVSVTPTTASTSRIMSVRDATTLVQGSTAAYVVNAAAVALKDQYQLTKANSATASFTAATLSNSTGTGTAATTVRVNIRSAQTTSATYPANADAKFVWGKADTTNIANSVCPAVFSDNYVKAGSVNGNTADGNTTTIGTLQHLAGWSDSSSGYFGTFTTVASLNAIGTPGTYVLWVMYKDGTSKMYDDNQGQSNPLTWVLS